MSFGDRLKEARDLKGYSRTELALKLNITTSAISNYENGVSSPKEEILLRIFDVLEVEPNFLFQDSFSKENTTQPVTENKKKAQALFDELSPEAQKQAEKYLAFLLSQGEEKTK